MRSLSEWAEKPCLLTIAVDATGSRLRVSGVLRAYYSLTSLHGWALVPPQQHGGFASIRLTELNLQDAVRREVIDDGPARRLRFCHANDLVFELERDDAMLWAPPRVVRNSRYLYVGGRRRPVPEDWMLR